MKYLKKEKKKVSPFAIVLVVVLVAIALAAVLLMPRSPKDTTPPTETEPAATEEVTEATQPVTVPTQPPRTHYEVVDLVEGQIATPYGPLYYPEELADCLVIINGSQEPYTLEFYAMMEGKKEVRLFDISLGEGSGGNMGMAAMEAGDVSVNVILYNLTLQEGWSEGEFLTAQAMQDALNDLMNRLLPEAEQGQSQAPGVLAQPSGDDTVRNLEVETPYCILYFPAKWLDQVRHEVDESQEGVYKVHFYGQTQKQERLLFSIYFGGDEGEQLGAVMSSENIPVPVYLILGQLDPKGLEESDLELLYEMQDDTNLLIEKLPLLH